MLNVHLYPSSITHESRIERMTAALAEAGVFEQLLIVGTQPSGLPKHQRLDARRTILRVPRIGEAGSSLLAKIIKTRSWTARVYRQLAAGLPVACVTCHSLAVLPLCVRLARRHRAKLAYEPHELETETAHSRGLRKLLMQRLEQRWIRHVDATVVVSAGIARWYEKRYGIARVAVVRNIPALRDELPPVDLRARLGVPAGHPVFVYSGGLFPGRRVEQFLRIFAAMPADRHVLFMGFGQLVPLVEEAARRHPNIHYIPAVPPREVLAHLAGADVGLSGVENLSLSYYFSLPNKQFEYLHAGLGSIVPNYPEMSRLIAVTGAGWVVPDDSDEAWRAAVLALGPTEIAQGREKARAAAQVHTLEREMSILLEVYAGLGFPPRTSPGT